MVPAEGVHSCYDAERVTRHREAEEAVVEAALALKAASKRLADAFATLRELEGTA